MASGLARGLTLASFIRFQSPLVTPASTAGTESFLGFFTVTNGSTASKTAEPFQFCWPVAAGSQSGALKVYTSDTSGNRSTALANFQIDATASDVSTVRNQVLSGVTGISGSQSLKFWVYDSPDPPPVGTAISSASLLSTSWRISASFTIGGTTSIVDTSGFGAATTSFSASQVVYHGRWLEGGARTCHVWSAPVQSGGNGLRLWFHAYASKADAGAVSAGNAITVVDCDLVIRNMDVTRATPSNYFYGLTIARSTSLSDGTLITTDQTDIDGNVTRMVYARSTPSATITATLATTTGSAATWVRSTGSWDTDVLGAHIRAPAGGGAYITSRVSNTTASVYVYEAFTTTSLTSGNWTQEGVGHWYGGTWSLNVIVGTAPTSVALWGDNTSAVTPTTIAAIDYLKTTGVFENYGFNLAAVSASGNLSTTNLNNMRGDSAIRPFTLLGPVGSFMGDLITDIGRGGGRPDIGIINGYALAGLANYTAVGRRKIFENARYFYTADFCGYRRYSGSPAAGNLGLSPRPDNGTDYKANTGFTGTLIPFPMTTWEPWENDTAHAPSTAFPAYMASGRLVWLDALQEVAVWSSWVAIDSGYGGTGINKTPWGDSTNSTSSASGDVPFAIVQQRSSAWGFWGLISATLATPDASKPNIYNDKSCYLTWIDNAWKRGDFARTGYTDNATASKNFFAASGPRYAGYWFATNNSQYASYQSHFMAWTMNVAADFRLTSTVSSAFYSWYAVDTIESYTSPDVAPDYMTTAYWVPRMSTPSGTSSTYCQTWAEVYQAYALYPPGYDPSDATTSATPPTRPIPQSMTLSGLSGTITASFTGSPFGAGPWYAGNGGTQSGGWVTYGPSGTRTSGSAQIISVPNANTLILSTTVSDGISFTTTSPSSASVRIPMPHPNDAPADGTLAARDSNYMQLYRRACVGWQDRGITSVSACITYIEGSVGFPATMDIQLWVNPR